MGVFAIGDKVETIDDVIKGTIVEIKEDQITVESSDGFLFNFVAKELVRRDKSQHIRVSNLEVDQIKSEKEIPKKRNTTSPKSKERSAPKMEVDLHINQLTNSTKGLSNHDMLNLQLETARRQLQFAIQKRIQKVVFIHGVGEGTLKEELYYLFNRYDNITFYDADYQKYGLGATEVYIYQNP